MNCFKRVLFASFCITLSATLGTAKAQNSSVYVIKSGAQTISVVPRPDLGLVILSTEQEPETDVYGGLLSSQDDVDIRKIRGLNKRSYSVLINDSSDEIQNNAFELMQSRSEVTYRAPLLTVNGQTAAVIPEIVVRLSFEDAYNDLLALCERRGLTVRQKMEFTRKEYLLEVPGTDEKSVFDAIADLEQAQFIEWAVPNFASQPVLSGFVTPDDEETEVIPNDEYFSQLWHMYNTGPTGGTTHADINAPNAWRTTSGDPNVIVAILDSGVDMNHPDLVNNLVSGYDFVDDDNDPSPSLKNSSDAHGTMCAGLAAAQGNNNIGICGVAWNCKIMPVRISDDDDFITDADIATAMRWAAAHGADILSNSWGSYYPSQIIYSAILDVTEQNGIGRSGKGCIVCCAAGNWEEGGPVVYPAARPEVIAIGATDHDDAAWYYSASGPELDIVAPSGAMTRADYFFLGKAYLWTTDITGIYGYSIENIDTTIWDYSDTMHGTSGACPLVAGVAALVLSVDPNLTNIEVQRILLDTSVDLGEAGKDEYYGFGRVDANEAVQLALNPPSTPPTSMITLYVDDNAPDDPCWGDPEFSDPNEDGTYRHPFDSIQKAVDFALYSETILVLDGTYTGNGNCDIDFLGKPLSVISENGPESCIIDCQDSGRGFYLHNNEPPETQIEGFTIENGMAYDGAGIYCSNGSSPSITNCIISDCWAYAWGSLGGEGGGVFTDSSCNPILTNCTFSRNSASWDGGGICISYGNPTLNNCTFDRNMAGDWGGGLCNYYGSPMLTDCNFSENSAESYGGGLFNEVGYPVLTNCTFSKNEVIEYDGGGVYNDYGDLIIEGCTFINNAAAGWGAGFYTLDSYGTTLTNCLFYGNFAYLEGGAIYSDESIAAITNCTFASNDASDGNAIACDSWWFGSELVISNCIIWDGLSSVWNNDYSLINISYSDVQKTGTNPWQGIGNINKDPLFADPDNGDYHLKSQAGRWDQVSESWVVDDIATSPCIDAGNPASDFSKEPAPNGSRINMGAFGGTSQASKSA
ncbi:MAG: S8 family serine peptidase, partial [Sedimentisphaerales bacterium]